jgi:hypothetical protein
MQVVPSTGNTDASHRAAGTTGNDHPIEVERLRRSASPSDLEKALTWTASAAMDLAPPADHYKRPAEPLAVIEETRQRSQ